MKFRSVPSRSGQIPNEKSPQNRLKRRRFGEIRNVHSAKETFLLESKFHYGEREGDPPAADERRASGGLLLLFYIIIMIIFFSVLRGLTCARTNKAPRKPRR